MADFTVDLGKHGLVTVFKDQNALSGPYSGFDPAKDPYLQSNPPRQPVSYNPDKNILPDLARSADTTGRNMLAMTAGLPGDIASMVPGSQNALAGNFPTSDELVDTFGGSREHLSYWPTAIAAPGPGELGAGAKAAVGVGKGLLSAAPDVLNALSNTVGGGISMAQALFHGTPHKFDKFALDKIGTGEGAQAFGHGLYFAENPGVARSYKSSISQHYKFTESNATINGKPFSEFRDGLTHRQDEILDSALTDAAEGFQRGWFDDIEYGDEMAELIEGKMRYSIEDPVNGLYGNNGQPLRITQADVDAITSKIDSAKFSPDPGHLYEVDIPDETTAKMLDWDAPLSEQPESVRKAIENAGGTITDSVMRESGGNATAATYYASLSQDLGGQEAASKALNEAGIPGIRFYDGMSRNSKVKVTDKSLHRLSGGVAENYLSTTNNNVEAAIKKLRSDIDSMPQSGRQQFIDAANGLESGTIKPSGTRNIVVFNPDDITQVKRDGEEVFNALTPKAPTGNALVGQGERVYHGTNKGFTEFDPQFLGASTGSRSARKAVWFTDNPELAGRYADLAADKEVTDLVADSTRAESYKEWDRAHDLMVEAEKLDAVAERGQQIRPATLEGKIFEVDMEGQHFWQVGDEVNEILDKAKTDGFDGVKFSNLVDDPSGLETSATHYAMFDTKKIVNALVKND